MSLKDISQDMFPAIEAELQRQVASLDEAHTRSFYEMITYHMGWTGQGAGLEAQGKRIRPLLVLLTSAATGIDWKSALPAAAAVELVHNFSLVHDDIQDRSEKRRGRETVWVKWGLAQGINAGDALFVLANHAIADLLSAFPAEVVLQAAALLHGACLDLTRGQFLDISYEKRTDLAIEDYWPMVGGKTAALMATCTALGSLLGGAAEDIQEAYQSFGQYMGLAFQVQDDLLGIWGDSALTGKSTGSDLVTGKLSLPVLIGLGKAGVFARRWQAGPIQPEETAKIAELLAEEGVRLAAQEIADQMTDLAFQFLRTANPPGEAGRALFELTDTLLVRRA
jgi:geranylgeranyl diphosphate synthase type I